MPAASEIAKIIAKNIARRAATKKIPAKEAREVARQARQNPSGRKTYVGVGPRKGVMIEKKASGAISAKRPMKRTTKPTPKTVTKSYQKERRTPTDVLNQRMAERNKRVREALTPIKPRGTKSTGKKGDGLNLSKNKANLIDKESGKMKSIEARQPRPKERETQYLTKGEYKSLRESERRVSEGLRDIARRERALKKKGK